MSLIHWKRFFEFEEENDLFQLREDDLYIWDIIRFQVYWDYMWGSHADLVPRRKIIHKITEGIIWSFYLFTFLFKRSRPNLFFLHSRDRTADGHFYDKNADDFLQRLYKESHILETFPANPREYLYSVSLILPAILFNVPHYLFYKKRDYTGLLDKINTGLGLHWSNEKINRLMSDFKSEKVLYANLLRFKKIKKIYITQFGIQKALFWAARKYNIEIVEFQHGIIDPGHLAYHYPLSITSKSPIYVPDVLLTFSTFWTQDINYPVKKIIATGNTGFSNPGKAHPHPNASIHVLGFISADVFGRKMADLAREYAAFHKDDTVLFKLHPNEFKRKKEYLASFKNFPNIRVITSEYPTEDFILSCDAIALIQSTIAYQALQVGVPVFIYQEMTYYRHEHIFDMPNVKLVASAQEIIVTDGARHGSSAIFFEKFNESAYDSLSNFK